jgi:hypothetical protein
MRHVGVRGEDRLEGSGREDVFTDDPDYVTFPTDGIEPAESAQLPGVLTSHKHNGERNSTFFLLRAARNEMNGTYSTKNTKRKT